MCWSLGGACWSLGDFARGRLVAQESLDPANPHESEHVRLARRHGTAEDVALFTAREAAQTLGRWNRGRTIDDILEKMAGEEKTLAERAGEAPARPRANPSAECKAALARLKAAEQRAHEEARERVEQEAEEVHAQRAKRAKKGPRKQGWRDRVLKAHFAAFELPLNAKARAQKKREAKNQQATRERAWVQHFGSATRHYDCDLRGGRDSNAPGTSAAHAALFEEAEEPQPRIARARQTVTCARARVEFGGCELRKGV